MISQHDEFPVELGWSFRVILGTEIQDDTLNTCASLFSNHYGVWGEQAETVSRFTKPGMERCCSMIGRDLEPSLYRSKD